MSIRDISIAAVLALAFTSRADDPPNPFAALLAGRAKVNASVDEKMAAYGLTIQSEEKQGRLEAEDAKKERARISEFRLRVAAPTPARPMGLPQFREATKPTNAALAKGWDECLAALTELEQMDLKLTKDITAHSTAAWNAANKSSDLAAAIYAIETVAQQIGDSATRRAGTIPLSKLSGFLRSSQRFLEAIEIGNAEIAEGAWREITGAGQFGSGPGPMSFSGSGLLPLSEIERWRVRFESGVRGELKAANFSVSEALIRKAPTADMLKLVDTIDALNGRLRAVLTPNLRSTGRQPLSQENIARKVSALLISAERVDAAAMEQALSGLSQSAEALTPAALTAAQEVRAGALNRKRMAEQEKATALEKRIRERIARVTDADAAIAFADELHAEIPAMEGSREASPLAALETDLRFLTLLWTEENTTLFRNDSFGQQARTHPWSAEIKELRKKAFRVAFARGARVPEIMKPPFDKLALDAAIRELAKQAFKRQEWHRLNEVLLASANLSREVRPSEYDDELRAVKGLMIGENFERAEQFADAVLSYRAVLNCVGELVPVDAAAARLKALKKEHPDAFPKELPQPEGTTRKR